MSHKRQTSSRGSASSLSSSSGAPRLLGKSSGKPLSESSESSGGSGGRRSRNKAERSIQKDRFIGHVTCVRFIENGAMLIAAVGSDLQLYDCMVHHQQRHPPLTTQSSSEMRGYSHPELSHSFASEERCLTRINGVLRSSKIHGLKVYGLPFTPMDFQSELDDSSHFGAESSSVFDIGIGGSGSGTSGGSYYDGEFDVVMPPIPASSLPSAMQLSEEFLVIAFGGRELNLLSLLRDGDSGGVSMEPALSVPLHCDDWILDAVLMNDERSGYELAIALAHCQVRVYSVIQSEDGSMMSLEFAHCQSALGSLVFSGSLHGNSRKNLLMAAGDFRGLLLWSVDFESQQSSSKHSDEKEPDSLPHSERKDNIKDTNKKELVTFRGRKKGAVLDVRFSRNGKYLATASDDRSVELWRVEKSSKTTTKSSTLASSSSSDPSSDPMAILSASQETGEVRAHCLFGAFGHKGRVMRCWISASGRSIVSVSEDCTAKVWRFDGTLLTHFDCGRCGAIWSVDAFRVGVHRKRKEERKSDDDGDAGGSSSSKSTSMTVVSHDSFVVALGCANSVIRLDGFSLERPSHESTASKSSDDSRGSLRSRPQRSGSNGSEFKAIEHGPLQSMRVEIPESISGKIGSKEIDDESAVVSKVDDDGDPAESSSSLKKKKKPKKKKRGHSNKHIVRCAVLDPLNRAVVAATEDCRLISASLLNMESGQLIRNEGRTSKSDDSRFELLVDFTDFASQFPPKTKYVASVVEHAASQPTTPVSTYSALSGGDETPVPTEIQVSSASDMKKLTSEMDATAAAAASSMSSPPVPTPEIEQLTSLWPSKRWLMVGSRQGLAAIVDLKKPCEVRRIWKTHDIGITTVYCFSHSAPQAQLAARDRHSLASASIASMETFKDGTDASGASITVTAEDGSDTAAAAVAAKSGRRGGRPSFYARASDRLAQLRDRNSNGAGQSAESGSGGKSPGDGAFSPAVPADSLSASASKLIEPTTREGLMKKSHQSGGLLWCFSSDAQGLVTLNLFSKKKLKQTGRDLKAVTKEKAVYCCFANASKKAIVCMKYVCDLDFLVCGDSRGSVVLFDCRRLDNTGTLIRNQPTAILKCVHSREPVSNIVCPTLNNPDGSAYYDSDSLVRQVSLFSCGRDGKIFEFELTTDLRISEEHFSIVRVRQIDFNHSISLMHSIHFIDRLSPEQRLRQKRIEISQQTVPDKMTSDTETDTDTDADLTASAEFGSVKHQKSRMLVAPESGVSVSPALTDDSSDDDDNDDDDSAAAGRSSRSARLLEEKIMVVSGFHGADFIVWNASDDCIIGRVECGGFKRPHTFAILDGSHSSSSLLSSSLIAGSSPLKSPVSLGFGWYFVHTDTQNKQALCCYKWQISDRFIGNLQRPIHSTEIHQCEIIPFGKSSLTMVCTSEDGSVSSTKITLPGYDDANDSSVSTMKIGKNNDDPRITDFYMDHHLKKRSLLNTVEKSGDRHAGGGTTQSLVSMMPDSLEIGHCYRAGQIGNSVSLKCGTFVKSALHKGVCLYFAAGAKHSIHVWSVTEFGVWKSLVNMTESTESSSSLSLSDDQGGWKQKKEDMTSRIDKMDVRICSVTVFPALTAGEQLKSPLWRVIVGNSIGVIRVFLFDERSPLTMRPDGEDSKTHEKIFGSVSPVLCLTSTYECSKHYCLDLMSDNHKDKNDDDDDHQRFDEECAQFESEMSPRDCPILVFSSSTQGWMLIWQWDSTGHCMNVLSRLKLHQSGINSMSVCWQNGIQAAADVISTGRHKRRFVAVTAGDDQSMSIIIGDVSFDSESVPGSSAHPDSSSAHVSADLLSGPVSAESSSSSLASTSRRMLSSFRRRALLSRRGAGIRVNIIREQTTICTHMSAVRGTQILRLPFLSGECLTLSGVGSGSSSKKTVGTLDEETEDEFDRDSKIKMMAIQDGFLDCVILSTGEDQRLRVWLVSGEGELKLFESCLMECGLLNDLGCVYVHNAGALVCGVIGEGQQLSVVSVSQIVRRLLGLPLARCLNGSNGRRNGRGSMNGGSSSKHHSKAHQTDSSSSSKHHSKGSRHSQSYGRRRSSLMSLDKVKLEEEISDTDDSTHSGSHSRSQSVSVSVSVSQSQAGFTPSQTPTSRTNRSPFV